MYYAQIDFNGSTGKRGIYLGGMLELTNEPRVFKHLKLIKEQSECFPDPGIGIFIKENDDFKFVDDIRWKENPEKLEQYIKQYSVEELEFIDSIYEKKYKAKYLRDIAGLRIEEMKLEKANQRIIDEENELIAIRTELKKAALNGEFSINHKVITNGRILTEKTKTDIISILEKDGYLVTCEKIWDDASRIDTIFISF